MGIQITVFADDKIEDVSAWEIEQALKKFGLTIYKTNVRPHTPKSATIGVGQCRVCGQGKSLLKTHICVDCKEDKAA